MIRNAFVNNQLCLAVFFDIGEAYDAAWRYGILRDAAAMGISRQMFSCIDFLQEQTFNVRLGDMLSRTFSRDSGVPRGSMLSVTLFTKK